MHDLLFQLVLSPPPLADDSSALINSALITAGCGLIGILLSLVFERWTNRGRGRTESRADRDRRKAMDALRTENQRLRELCIWHGIDPDSAAPTHGEVRA